MSKKPDLSNLTEKFDLDKILGGIKSMINPEAGSPDIDPNDALGAKMHELSTILRELAVVHADAAKTFAHANDLLSAMAKDIQQINGTGQGSESGEAASTPDASGNDSGKEKESDVSDHTS